mmetsp:Transcript_102985/g.266700  ORF Transcript_102985/g.266700 Transcript_102985/m.266700 type:complete len:376 (-) Transcript_102985:83-1210(-)
MQPATTVSGPVLGAYPGGTVIRPATTVQPGQVTYAAAPGQTVITAAPQYVTPAAPQTTAVASAQVLSGSTRSVITAPAQYVTPGAPRTVTTAAPAVTYAAPPSSTVPATTVIRSSAAAPAGASISAPTTTLTGSVVRMAAPATVVRQAAVPVQSRPPIAQGPDYTQVAYEQKHADDPQLQNLKDIRKTSGLKHVPVGDGLSYLKGCATDGKLTREQFMDAYAALLQANSIEAPGEDVQHAVFDLFDRDGNNVVDMMELICGISLLCSGTEDDKIHAVFNIFDENGDGFVSMDEMFKFLTSVFKVVLTPNVMNVMNSMGVQVESAEDLASVTSLECFKTADLNHDGKLSVTEFKNWFYAPRNDPSFLFSPVRKLLQ